jgi:hypothetical protein
MRAMASTSLDLTEIFDQAIVDWSINCDAERQLYDEMPP